MKLNPSQNVHLEPIHNVFIFSGKWHFKMTLLGNANPGNPKPGYPGYLLFCQTRNPGLRKPGFTQTRLNPGLLETKPGFLKAFSTTISVVNLIKQIIFNRSRSKFSKSNPSQASLPGQWPLPLASRSSGSGTA